MGVGDDIAVRRQDDPGADTGLFAQVGEHQHRGGVYLLIDLLDSQLLLPCFFAIKAQIGVRVCPGDGGHIALEDIHDTAGIVIAVVEVIAIAVRIAAPQGGDDGHSQHHAYQHGQNDQKRPQALAAAALLLPDSFGRRGSGHGARLHIAARDLLPLVRTDIPADDLVRLLLRGRSRRIGRQRHFIFIIHIQSTSRGAPCAICMVKVKAVTPS